MNFSKNLKAVREHLKLSQIKMAELLFMSQSNYNKYEKGKLRPSSEFIKRIATQLNISEAVLENGTVLFEKNSDDPGEVYVVPKELFNLISQQKTVDQVLRLLKPKE